MTHYYGLTVFGSPPDIRTFLAHIAVQLECRPQQQQNGDAMYEGTLTTRFPQHAVERIVTDYNGSDVTVILSGEGNAPLYNNAQEPT